LLNSIFLAFNNSIIQQFNPMKPTLADYLHLHFIVLIWGFTAILGLLLEPLSASALVLWRTGLAAAGLGLVLQWRGQRLGPGVAGQPTGRTRWQFLATGGLIALHWITFFLAARLANASVCLAGLATTALWTSLLDPLINRRRVKAVEVGLGLVVIAGLYVIFRFEFDKGAGLLMAVFSAALSALFTIINSRWAHRYEALTISFYELSGAFLFSALLLPFFMGMIPVGGTAQPMPITAAELIPQTGWQWLWLALLAGVCTVYAYTAGVQLLRKFTAFAAVLTVNLEPVYGILLAVLIFGDRERMTPGFYVGTLVILGAVLAYPLLNRSVSLTE
jgi:drug/metabolite transporter (DMT)-like permease